MRSNVKIIFANLLCSLKSTPKTVFAEIRRYKCSQRFRFAFVDLLGVRNKMGNGRKCFLLNFTDKEWYRYRKLNWEGKTWCAAVVSQNGDFAMEYRVDTTAKEADGYPLTYRGGPRYDTIKGEYLKEYPIVFNVNGVQYGDNGDYIGVELISYLVSENTVVLMDGNDTASVVLLCLGENQYKVVCHINENQNTYLHKNLPVGTIFTLVKE